MTYPTWAMDEDCECLWFRLDCVRDPAVREEAMQAAFGLSDEFVVVYFKDLPMSLAWGGPWNEGNFIEDAHEAEDQDVVVYAQYTVEWHEDVAGADPHDPYAPPDPRPGQGLLIL